MSHADLLLALPSMMAIPAALPQIVKNAMNKNTGVQSTPLAQPSPAQPGPAPAPAPA